MDAYLTSSTGTSSGFPSTNIFAEACDHQAELDVVFTFVLPEGLKRPW